MRKIITQLSPFRLLAVAIILLELRWFLIVGNGGPHGYGTLLGIILLLPGGCFLFFDFLLNKVFKNSKSASYVVQLVVIAVIFLGIYFRIL